MSHTDMSEAGFEAHIEAVMRDQGYLPGLSSDFDRDHAVDLEHLFAFLLDTQPKKLEAMGISAPGLARDAFLLRLRDQITERGVIDVLLRGVDHHAEHVDLFYRTPSAHNATASRLFERNRFSLTRQVRFSKKDPDLSIDLVLFLNGLPLATFELKNSLTRQTYHDAIRQYQQTRSPKELLFMPGRCAVHLALDESQAYFCAELKGAASWFLPFNKGHDDGAGNPPNPQGFRTEYVWREVFAPASLIDIIEHYARTLSERDPLTKKKRTRYIWPRYHQLQAVRALLADASTHGPGRRYLIQHSAGSGKSYSITWLAHQLVNLRHPTLDEPMFHTVLVITDRRVLDTQIRNEIKRFMEVKAVVGAVTEGSAELRRFLEQGKRVITSTIQKFPFILDELGNAHRDKRFALIIDEAHSSQGGKSAAAVNRALAQRHAPEQEEEDPEEQLLRIMTGRKMLDHASYFAFTATPKNKTEELFGSRQPDGSFRPFHSYTMKQAIQEGFIRDVLANYTTVKSYYRLLKTVEHDPEFDVSRAQNKLRRYVESHEDPLRAKADVMLDHFVREVWRPALVGGKAKAMVVTDGVQRVIDYKRIFDALIAERHLPFKVLVAFSGERDLGGKKVTEATLNGFPSADIPERFREDDYKILIVADKFQTGFDEPLLQTMYVDKALSDVKAVQTLSRLNRAHPKKSEVFVLDFANEAKVIQEAFARYYRTTLLSEGSDVNKLHDLKQKLDLAQVYTERQVEDVVELFLSSSPREHIEGILNGCVESYMEELDEDEQVEFKGGAKSFVRLYNFLSALVEFHNARWEKLAIFLNFLIPKLPSPKEEDMSRGLLETIDLDSYRNEVQARQKIQLDDAEGTLSPIPMSAPGGKPEAQLDLLSNIVREFNEIFGADTFEDANFAANLITTALPSRVLQDEGMQHALKQGDSKKIAIEEDRAIQESIIDLQIELAGQTSDVGKLYKGFVDEPQLQRFIREKVHEVIVQRLHAQAMMAHPGWEEILPLLDPQWLDFARELRRCGVPAPDDVEMELEDSEEQLLMVWFDKYGRGIGLIEHATDVSSPIFDLMTFDRNAPRELARELRIQLESRA